MSGWQRSLVVASTCPKCRREVRWAISIVVLIFVVELVVLPDIANVRKSVSLLGRVNFAYLFLAVALEVAALLSYAELSRSVLNPNAPGRWRMFRINMASLSISHVAPRWRGAGLGDRLPAAARVRRLGPDGRLRAGHPGHRLGRGLERHLLGGAHHLDPLQRLQPPLRHRGRVRRRAHRRLRRHDPPPHQGQVPLDRLAAPAGHAHPVRDPRAGLPPPPRGGRPARGAAARPPAARASARVGGGQLVLGRGVARRVPARPRRPPRPDRPAGRLRPRQHPGGHPDHARRPRGHRGHLDPDHRRLPRPEDRRHPRRHRLSPGQLLAADPGRRSGLPVAAHRRPPQAQRRGARERRPAAGRRPTAPER